MTLTKTRYWFYSQTESCRGNKGLRQAELVQAIWKHLRIINTLHAMIVYESPIVYHLRKTNIRPIMSRLTVLFEDQMKLTKT